MKNETNKTMMIISAVLGMAAIILLIISIAGDFETNLVMQAGLACAAAGSLINAFSLIRNMKKQH